MPACASAKRITCLRADARFLQVLALYERLAGIGANVGVSFYGFSKRKQWNLCSPKRLQRILEQFLRKDLAIRQPKESSSRGSAEAWKAASSSPNRLSFVRKTSEEKRRSSNSFRQTSISEVRMDSPNRLWQ